MFIAITEYKRLDSHDAVHLIDISPYIDRLILRTPMSDTDLAAFLTRLLESGFPPEKVVIHSSIDLLESFKLQFIHFKEHDIEAFKYKEEHPEISVSMSTHSAESIKKAQLNGLDSVLFGHIFESASKKSLPPRTNAEIKEAVSFDIPVIALGGINLYTIEKLPAGFDGISSISGFMDATHNQIINLRKEWHRLNSM